MLVGLERGHQPRRGGVHERAHALPMPVERGAEAADIVAQPARASLSRTGPIAGGADELLAAHDRGELLRQRRMRREIERGLALDMPAEAREPLGDVGRITDLAELAVADDRDAGRDLFLHGFVDGALDDPVELGRVVRLAMSLREQERDEFVAARQAPDMGDFDPSSRHLEQAPLPFAAAVFARARPDRPARRNAVRGGRDRGSAAVAELDVERLAGDDRRGAADRRAAGSRTSAKPRASTPW